MWFSSSAGKLLSIVRTAQKLCAEQSENGSEFDAQVLGCC